MKKRILALVLALLIPLSSMTWAVSDTHETGTPIAYNTTSIETSGDYYLAANVQLDSGITISGTGTVVNLYLNDRVLTGTSAKSVITVEYPAVLNIYDVSSGTLKTFDDPTSVGVDTDLQVYGGVITGGTCTAQFGGGGILVNGGTVNFHGGNIVGNSTTDTGTTLGGGVYVGPHTVGDTVYYARYGYFNMYGGTIQGNTSSGHGGGVYVKGCSYFNMEDGAISYNYNGSTYGGGVYVVGTTTMTGGTISHNYALKGGGGLSVVGPFIMSGGTVAYNETAASGGGALIGDNASITMSGYASINNNVAGGNSGGVVVTKTSSKLAMSGDAEIVDNTAAGLGGGVTLSNGTWTVEGNAQVTGNTVEDYTVNGYLPSGATITVVDDFDGTVGVTYAEGMGVVATGTDSRDLTASDKDGFTSDDEYQVIMRTDETTSTDVGNRVELVSHLTDVGNTASVYYSANTIDVSTLGMFDLDFADVGFGAFTSSDITATPTYTITAGTGQGEVNGQYLDVTHVGTFTVTMTTATCDTAPSTSQSAVLTVDPIEVTITDLLGVERRYDSGDTTVEIASGTIVGVIDGDNVEIDYDKAYGVITTNAEGGVAYSDFNATTDTEATYNMNVYDLVLTGSKAGNYILEEATGTGTVTINQTVPYISWPAANDITIGTNTAESQLLGGKVMVDNTSDWSTVTGHFEFEFAQDESATNLEAGTYTRTVKFVPDEGQSVDSQALEYIVDARRTVSQIVEAAAVQFTVADNGTVSATVLDSTVSIGQDDYVITEYTWSSDPDITLVAVAFTDNSFRHAGTLESTGKQVGAYYTGDTPYNYTVTFYDTDGTTELGTITGADPQDIHILPSNYTGDGGEKIVAWETTWATVTTSYDVESRYPQPLRDVDFTAVYEPATTTITGIVTGTDLDGTDYPYGDGTGLSHIGVTLMQGSEIIATATTDETGAYTFDDDDVYEGKYNVVFTRDYGTRTEVTVFVDTDSSTDCSVDLPDGNGDNSILYIAPGMTAITVQNYNAAIVDAASRLNITSVDTATANAMIAYVDTYVLTEQSVTADNLKLFYDIEITKRGDSETTYTQVNATNAITYYIPLSGIYQNKDNYKVFYMGDDGIAHLVEDAYGTFSVNVDKDMITLTAKNSGVYGIYFETLTNVEDLLASECHDKTVTYQVASFQIDDVTDTDTDTVYDMFDLEGKGVNPSYTISSDDGGVATIDSSGNVTVTTVGTFTITVTTEATENESAYTGSATLTVDPKPVTISEITTVQQASITDDATRSVTLNDTAYIAGVEHGDQVTVNLNTGTGEATGTITDTDYWTDTTLNSDEGQNTFDVEVVGLSLLGDDAGNYDLQNNTYTTTVLIYQDTPYFSWPTAIDVVYGTARTDDDLYGGKVMVKDPISGGWELLSGHFEWVFDDASYEYCDSDEPQTYDGGNEIFTADEAGTVTHYVKFVEDNPDDTNTYHTTVTTTVQPVTQVVQRAQVQFTVENDGTVTAWDIDNNAAVNESFQVNYVNEDTGEWLTDSGVPTETGTYFVGPGFLYTEVTDTNYRHAGSSDSTAKYVGVYYVGIVPDTYTVTFEVSEGDTPPAEITDAVWGDIHILPTLTQEVGTGADAYPKYSGWYCVETEATYEFGARFAQQKYDMTLVAVETPVHSCTISGTITGTDLDGTPGAYLQYVAVTLMQGTEMVAYTETDALGNYSFTVAEGVYNLDVTRDQYNVQNEMTVFVSVYEDVDSGDGYGVTVKDFNIPDTTQNAELLVTTGGLDVVVSGLTTLVETVANLHSASETTIHLGITDDGDAGVDMTAIESVRDDNGLTADELKLFMNVDLTQTINGVESPLTELPDGSYLTFYLPLAGLYQNYDNYYVYRAHDYDGDGIITDDEVDVLNQVDSEIDGECIWLVSADLLAVKASKFSLYGVAFDDDVNTYVPPSGSTTTTTTTTEDEVEEETGATLNRDDHNAYMNGYPDDTFGATRNITRAETVVMFSRLIVEQMEMDQSYTNTFTDVTDNLWYYDNIGFMEQFGIINGYGDGTFGGDDYITRAEFAAIVCRFDNLSSDETCPFSDVSDTFWAASSITAAVEKGWITGYENGTFCPDQYITRAEAVTLVNRVLERYCDQDYVDSNPDLIVHFTDLDSDYWAYYQIMEATHSHDYDKVDTTETWTEILWHTQMP